MRVCDKNLSKFKPENRKFILDNGEFKVAMANSNKVKLESREFKVTTASSN